MAEELAKQAADGKKPFLAGEDGLESGLMMVQVTAAALVCETRNRCVPAAAESLPTSANVEDHVSLSPLAARKARAQAEDVATVLAIEVLAACRGLDHRLPLRPGKGVAAAHDLVRSRVPARAGDRPLSPEISAVRELVVSGGLLEAAEAAAGPLAGIPAHLAPNTRAYR